MSLEPSAVVLSVAAATAAGLVGPFALMRRMTLASDAISHIALPGIGLAILFGVHPLLGGVAMLMLGALLIWGLENRTRIATETIIGVVFTTALAVGTLLTSGHDLVEALLGGVGHLGPLETAVAVAGAGAVIVFVLVERHKLVLALVSPEIARTAGIDVSRLNLRFLLVFALTIALGLRYLGVLLMGALVIVPAATAKRVARGLGEMLGVAVVVSVVSTTAGLIAAVALHRETGPIIVLVAAACFFASLLVRRST
jgi:ABC-type Mn2+/Zn2+ transport system permease subunit